MKSTRVLTWWLLPYRSPCSSPSQSCSPCCRLRVSHYLLAGGAFGRFDLLCQCRHTRGPAPFQCAQDREASRDRELSEPKPGPLWARRDELLTLLFSLQSFSSACWIFFLQTPQPPYGNSPQMLSTLCLPWLLHWHSPGHVVGTSSDSFFSLISMAPFFWFLWWYSYYRYTIKEPKP